MTIRITHRRDQNGKNILFKTNQGDYTPAQIASKINAGEDTFVGNTSTRVHVVRDDPRYIRSNPNNRNNDDLDRLPSF